MKQYKKRKLFSLGGLAGGLGGGASNAQAAP